MVVGHVILVSAQVPIGLGFFTSLGLGLGLGLGGQGLGLELDNWCLFIRSLKSESYSECI